ncbi:TetR/AcrR family transcriptional regulator [Enterocloster bolteae]|nr:TetR family transcriptional regulator [Enterocloster bolteae]MCG4901122.1 TetR/AcrR family transcriptional regulator [Enterocloster bolteae]UOX71308.1 TetR/AcrR family transcriptional regulator [Enterocloster bolteae]
MDVAMDAGKGYNISMNQDKRHKISTREVRFALDEITDIRKKLSEAMEYLLSRKKLDDIPVSEIAKMAGVSRRTFYRHFCDKYELVNWYYDEFYEESFGSIVLGAGLEEALTQCLKIYRQKRSVLKHAYESRDINGLKNHDIEITRRIYETFLKQRGADIRSEIMWFSIEIAVRGGSDMVIQWMLGNIDLPAEKMARLICETLPEEIKKYQMSPVTHV